MDTILGMSDGPLLTLPVPPDHVIFPMGFGLAAAVLGILFALALGKWSGAKSGGSLMTKEETRWSVISVFLGIPCGLFFIMFLVCLCLDCNAAYDKAYPDVEINQGSIYVIESEEK